MPQTDAEHTPQKFGELSVLSHRELKAHDDLLKAIIQLSNLYPNKRKRVYKRLEMLKCFTPEVTEIFEKNIRRISKSA